MKDPIVLSPYMSNISPRILSAQRRVFDAFEVPLEQVKIDGQHHGHWMTETARSAQGEIIVFCDIDAFPLNRNAYDKAVKCARDGKLFGLAQVANHLRPADIYAGPMFMSFSKEMYREIGEPTLEHDEKNDPAQNLTDVAVENGINIDLCYPTAAIYPKWPLADRGVFGIGTFYGEREFFHLFQSRVPTNIDLLTAVADDVSQRRSLDFLKYLDIINPAQGNPRLFNKLLGMLGISKTH